MECVGREITVREQWFSLLAIDSVGSVIETWISSTDMTAGLFGASNSDCVLNRILNAGADCSLEA